MSTLYHRVMQGERPEQLTHLEWAELAAADPRGRYENLKEFQKRISQAIREGALPCEKTGERLVPGQLLGSFGGKLVRGTEWAESIYTIRTDDMAKFAYLLPDAGEAFKKLMGGAQAMQVQESDTRDDSPDWVEKKAIEQEFTGKIRNLKSLLHDPGKHRLLEAGVIKKAGSKNLWSRSALVRFAKTTGEWIEAGNVSPITAHTLALAGLGRRTA